MKTKHALLIVSLVLGLAVLAGCASTRPAASPPAAAAAAPAPAAETVDPFHSIVDAAFVAQHITVPMADNVMLIDSRPRRPKYDEGHIPMAVSIPDSQFEKMTDQLPADKNALLIFYCGGLNCNLSHKSARKAETLGYKNVKVFAEGLPGWLKVPGNYASVSTEWVRGQLDGKADLLLVDSRPRRAKYDQGHIPGAVSLPDADFDELKARLPDDKKKPIVFYCEGFNCKLSHSSAKKTLALGYSDVKVYSAGYPAWKAAAGKGAMVAGATAAATAVAPASAALPSAGSASLKPGKVQGSLDHESFRQIMVQDPGKVMLIDVRDKEEFAKGTLKTAVNIPVDDLEARIKTLPTDKPIVFVCGTGARSGESYYMIKDLRPEMNNVYYVDGVMTIGKDGSFTLKDPA